MLVGIQADDLTGACDAGAVFARRGLATVVLLPGAPAPRIEPAVTVLDTESRGLSATEARCRAGAAADCLAAGRPSVLYKKVDSTLRGPLAAELAGVLEGSGLRHVILVPAFPAQRRVVIDGLLHVDGQRAEETPIARDPAFPTTGASVLALLGVDGPHPVEIIPLATVRHGPAAVACRLNRWPGALVCDAETDTDLDTLAAAATGKPILLAGSAGLAAAVAARLPAEAPVPAPRLRRPLLVVAGSAHPITRAQVARLRARGVGGTWLGENDGEVDEPAGTGTAGRFIAARGGTALEAPATRSRTAERLAAAARRILESPREGPTPGTLLLTGGETAVAACRVLEASGLVLAGEVEPGLALGALLDGPFQGLPVITKAGGFGDPETLVRVWEACA